MSTLPRALLAVGCAGALVASGTLGGSVLGLAAPFSGDVYETVDRDVERIESPYGPATVTYDAQGVPHVEADSERALYYAVGYVQARDRLFQMDLQRRLVSGHLAEAFGERAVESDRFYRQLDLERAANVTWRSLRDTEVGDAVRAYTDGVNRYVETGALPPEFALAGYEPRPWRPADTFLIDKQIAWTLSGSFADLEHAVVTDRLGSGAASLYPDRLDHDATIVRGRSDAAPFDPSDAPAGSSPDASARRARVGALAPVADWAGDYDVEPGIGSNSWVVSSAHTTTGRPVVANDPHLSLTVPPVWYEMHLTTPEMDVRGVGFPGAPFVLIGRTTDVAWGLTNVGADLTDHYAYETLSGGSAYRYRGEVRSFDARTETIRVSGAPDRTVRIRHSVHGSVLEREGRTVGVAWPGFAATNETLAIYRLNHAGSMADVRAALDDWDSPPQNVVAATRAGETLYRAAGRHPVRYTDGTVVRGDRVFDGSAGAGEWRGYEPFAASNWSGFVPLASVPRVDDPDYLATANQRPVDDASYYLGTSRTFADPYRGGRIYAALDARADADEPMDPAFHRDLQHDVRSRAAGQFVPIATADAARARMNRSADDLAARLVGWSGRMRADSPAALAFAVWLDEFRNATFHDEFAAEGLDDDYYPRDYVLGGLPADSRWFDRTRTRETETRADVAALAMERAAARIDREGYRTYGDRNRLELSHPFDRGFLNYPERPMNGSQYTVSNYRRDGPAGSSWRMVVSFDGESTGIVPGGQSGVFWSDHYRDQLDEWAGTGAKPLTLDAPDGPPDLVFGRGPGTGRGGEDGSGTGGEARLGAGTGGTGIGSGPNAGSSESADRSPGPASGRSRGEDGERDGDRNGDGHEWDRPAAVRGGVRA
jgi:penicillin amidase